MPDRRNVLPLTSTEAAVCLSVLCPFVSGTERARRVNAATTSVDLPMTDTPHEQEPGTDFDSQDTLLDGSLILAEFPSELLVILAEKVGKFGNPLALLVSKAHLSKAFCSSEPQARRPWRVVSDG